MSDDLQLRDLTVGENVGQGYKLAQLGFEIQSVALRKLIMIDHAETLSDLRVPPANHLEKLQGNRDGQYSVRINLKYRICFSCREDGFYDVEICDYH